MTEQSLAISMIGLGKLGLPIAACIAAKGIPVIGMDTDPGRVAEVNNRISSICEPGLTELLQSAGSNLTATTDIWQAVKSSNISIVIVPTPSQEDHTFSLKYTNVVCEQIGTALQHKNDYHLFVMTSTVMPGACDSVMIPLLEKHSHKKCGTDFGVCYSPEFVALGNVIANFLKPDFLLIGESDPGAGELLSRMYHRVCENDPPIRRMAIINAEISKIALNTYVTTKITYANLLGRICEQVPGADVDVITGALGCDHRIGPLYLKGAVAYGGPCFPRDNLALSKFCRDIGVDAALPQTTDRLNRASGETLRDRLRSLIPDNSTVAVLGLSYKPDTDVIEESPGIYLLQALSALPLRLAAYDPVANKAAAQVLESNIQILDSVQACWNQADVLILMTPWPQFKELGNMTATGKPRTIIDGWRMLKHVDWPENVTYVALGMGIEKSAVGQVVQTH